MVLRRKYMAAAPLESVIRSEKIKQRMQKTWHYTFAKMLPYNKQNQ